MKTALIAAIGPNNELGFQGGLPWKIKEDLAYFKKVTTGTTIIMGAATWKSLGEKPLPGRFHIVLSKTLAKNRGINLATINAVTVFYARDLEQAMFVAEYRKKPVFFIGGANVYSQVLHTVDEIYLTLVEKMTEPIKADTFFPEFDISKYDKVSEETYFTAEYTVTNLVLAKKSDGKRTNRESSSVADNVASGAGDRRITSPIHREGSGYLPGRTYRTVPRNY